MNVQIDRVLDAIKAIVLLSIAIVWSRVNAKKEEVWLFSERPDEARDNALYFFRHCNKIHGVENTRYVYAIASASPDLKAVGECGETVEWGSFSHYLIWCRAACVISTQLGNSSPNKGVCLRAEKYGLVRHRSVYLRHGVTVNQPLHIARYRYQLDLIVAATEREAELLAAALGQKAKAVKALGFCRFDRLSTTRPEKVILMAPTFRRPFRGLMRRVGEARAQEEFKESAYFTGLSAFLQAPALLGLLERHDHRLLFLPHYEVQPYSSLFPVSTDRIVIGSSSTHRIDGALSTCSILITDYSSVQFDVAYRRRGVIYYLPDERFYNERHAQAGEFDIRADGFGDVVSNANEVVAALQVLLDRDGTMPAEYSARADRFFGQIRTDSCERTFAEVATITSRRGNGQ